MVAEKPHDLNRVEHNELIFQKAHLQSCNTNINDMAREISPFFSACSGLHNAHILFDSAEQCT